MINFKKIDDKDFIFINKNPSKEEDKAFSEFLKNRKKRKKHSTIGPAPMDHEYDLKRHPARKS